MTLADDQERDRLAARQRELEAAKPWWSKLREWLDARAEGHDVALRMVVICVAIVVGWTLCRCGPAVHPGAIGPGTDWPCGYTAQSCGNGNCCWNDSVCGGVDGTGDGCMAGMCCFVGDEMASRRPVYTQIDEPDMVAGKVAH